MRSTSTSFSTVYWVLTFTVSLSGSLVTLRSRSFTRMKASLSAKMPWVYSRYAPSVKPTEADETRRTVARRLRLRLKMGASVAATIIHEPASWSSLRSRPEISRPTGAPLIINEPP